MKFTAYYLLTKEIIKMKATIRFITGSLVIGIAFVGGWWNWNRIQAEEIEKQSEGKVIDGLQLTIKSDKEIYKHHENIVITFSFKNVSKNTIYIYKSPVPMSDIIPEIFMIDAKGGIIKQIPIPLIVDELREIPTSDRDFQKIEANGMFLLPLIFKDISISTKSNEVSLCLAPGSYRFSVSLEFPDYLFSSEEITIKPWHGRIKSNTISIEVVTTEEFEKRVSYWLGRLNKWDKKAVEIYENPDKYSNYKDLGETNAWIGDCKAELKKLGVSVIWDNAERTYLISMTLKEAKEIGKRELKKQGYPLEEMDIKADDKNSFWYEYSAKNPSGLGGAIVERMNREGKKFWAIYFYPKEKEQLGGDVWVFIDASSSEVIGIIHGQ